MHSPKETLNQYAVKQSGLKRPYSIAERAFLGALNVSAWPVSVKWNLIVGYLILASLIFFSCGTRTRPDQAPAYSDGGYYSVEFEVCGRYYFGVGGCSFAPGASTNTQLRVQGFGDGEIYIKSELCNVQWKQRYSENQLVSVSLKQLLGTDIFVRAHSCTFKIIVAPDAIENSEEIIYPRNGEVAIEVRPANASEISLVADQVRASEAQQIRYVEVGEPGEYLLSLCQNSPIRGNYENKIELPLSMKTSCKYQLQVKTVSGKQLSGIHLRNVYERNVVLLARPLITRDEDEICVEADPATSTFVSINEKWKNKNKLCYKGKAPYKVRVWTTKRNFLEIVK